MSVTTQVAVFFSADEARLDTLRRSLADSGGRPSMNVLLPCPEVLTALVEQDRQEQERHGQTAREDSPDGESGSRGQALAEFLHEFLYATPIGGCDLWLADFPASGCDPTDGAFRELYARLRGRGSMSDEEALRDFTEATGGIHNTSDWRHEHWGTGSDWRRASLARGWLASGDRSDVESALLLRARVEDGEPVPYLQALARRFPDVAMRCVTFTGGEARGYVFHDGVLADNGPLEFTAEERAFMTRDFGDQD